MRKKILYRRKSMLYNIRKRKYGFSRRRLKFLYLLPYQKKEEFMHPEPILEFTLFNHTFSITLYGICISVGLIACLIVLKLYTDHRKMKQAVQDFIFFVAILAIALGFVGAMLFQSVYNYIEKGVWEFGAITAMGGFITGTAVFIAAYFGIGHFYFARGELKDAHKKEFNTILQVAPICVTIAHAFGRIGCLMAGCCHGAEVDGPGHGGIYMSDGYYIPTQLYESIFLFILFGVLSLLYFKRFNVIPVIYLISYGIWRFIIEFFRTDDRGSVGLGITPSQFQSIVFVLAGIAIFLVWYFKKYPFREPLKESVAESETKESISPKDGEE